MESASGHLLQRHGLSSEGVRAIREVLNLAVGHEAVTSIWCVVLTHVIRHENRRRQRRLVRAAIPRPSCGVGHRHAMMRLAATAVEPEIVGAGFRFESGDHFRTST